MTEPCPYEGDIAVLKDNTDDIRKTVDKIFSILEGKNGLVTKVELLEKEVENQPTPNQLRFYSTIGGGIVVFLGLIAWAIVRAIG
jgi:hypothetical protein